MGGQLIVVEGPDGVGKTTLAAHFQTLATALGLKADVLSFPGRLPGTLGNLVYELHHDSKRFGIKNISPLALQTLHIAAHLDATTEAIVPAITSGRWIILDRSWWSTWVYGRAAGIDPQILDTLILAEKLTLGNVKPSAVFLMERDTPAGSLVPNPEFAELTALYRQLSSAEAGQQEIVHIVNQDIESARNLVAEWLNRRQ